MNEQRRQLVVWACVSLATNSLLQVLPILLLGASRETDTFLLLLTPSAMIFAVAAGALPNVETPRLTALVAANGGVQPERQRHWIWLGGAAAALCIAPTPGLLLLTNDHGADGLGSAISVATIALSALGCGANVVGLGVISVLNACGRHVEAVRLTAAAATAGLGVALLSVPTLGVLGAAIALAVRGVFFSVKISLLTRGRTPSVGLSDVIRSARHLLASNSIFRSEIVIDRALAVLMAPGALSMYYVVTRGFSSASQIVNQTVNVPLLTRLAALEVSAPNSWSTVWRRSLRVAAAFGMLMYATVLVIAITAPWLITGRGHGDLPVVALAASLGGYAVLGCVGQVAPSALYATGRSAMVARLSVLAFVVGAGLKLGGSALFGVVGLGMATSAYHVVGLTLTMIATRRVIRSGR